MLPRFLLAAAATAGAVVAALPAGAPAPAHELLLLPRAPGGPDAAAKALQQKVNAAIRSGARTVELPGGVAHFGTTNLQIEGAHNLVLLVPKPLDLVFTTIAGETTVCPTLTDSQAARQPPIDVLPHA